MALFAKIVGGVVQRVIVVEPERDEQGRVLGTAQDHCDKLFGEKEGSRTWVQQKEHAHYPSKGDTYHAEHDKQFARSPEAVGDDKELDPDTLTWRKRQVAPEGPGR